VGRQLFEAIAFMHDNGVAHVDIKPRNIIIPPRGGKLTIIDFSSSVRVRDSKHMFCGIAGTKGYIAPEVRGSRGRKSKYNPIMADLWSCGKTLE
ncbi:kinase-like domain-containing protein, partial [Phlebopus sp. FC_14]